LLAKCGEILEEREGKGAHLYRKYRYTRLKLSNKVYEEGMR